MTVETFKYTVNNTKTVEFTMQPTVTKNQEWPFYLKNGNPDEKYWDIEVKFTKEGPKEVDLKFELDETGGEHWDFVTNPVENKGINPDCVTFKRDSDKTSMIITIDSKGTCVCKLGGFKFKAKNGEVKTISADPMIKVIPE